MKICLIIPDEMLLSTYAPDKRIPIIKGKIKLGLEVPLLTRQTRNNSLNKINVSNGTIDLCENQKQNIQPAKEYVLIDRFCISGYCLKIVTVMQPRNSQFSHLS